jgi:acetate kinase
MAIDIISKINPDILQIACFDTAFHADHDPLFTSYALPEKWRDKGIRHYGFHGLSYEWIAYALRRDEHVLATGRIIAAHLGNGASLCAMHNGVSIDTTTGMTALDGLPMGTRCGNLDPGAVIYIIRDLNLSPDEVEHILYSESGLLGLSGSTNNVKELQESADKNAQFALDYFSLKVAQFMGAMAVALGGVDGVIFTGGIGEHSAFVRDKILARIAFMKPFEVRVIPANEERMMAMQARACLESKG